MRGKTKTINRTITPDPKFNSEMLGKFVNYLMYDGKKSTAQNIIYKAFDEISKKESDKEPLEVFEEAVKNVSPHVEVRSRRVGGANYQVPIPVSPKRQRALAFRWILQASRGKKSEPISKRMADVLMESAQNVGDAVRKRDDVHRMAEANKAFAHFAKFR